jgi:hypothetical protein
VTREGLLTGSTTVSYAVTGSGPNPADADDFGGTLPSGQVTFAPGETVRTITIPVRGDTQVEPDEGFTVTLFDPPENVQTHGRLGRRHDSERRYRRADRRDRRGEA